MNQVDRLKEAYAAFNRGDASPVLAMMTPDTMWQEGENSMYAAGSPFVGPESVVRNVFVRFPAEWEGFRAAPEQFYEAGSAVIVTGRLTGRYKDTGRELYRQFVHIFTMAGDKIAKFQEFADTAHQRDVMARTLAAAG